MSKNDPMTNKEVAVFAVFIVLAVGSIPAAVNWAGNASHNTLTKAALGVTIAIGILFVGMVWALLLQMKRHIRDHVREHHSHGQSSHPEGATPSP